MRNFCSVFVSACYLCKMAQNIPEHALLVDTKKKIDQDINELKKRAKNFEYTCKKLKKTCPLVTISKLGRKNCLAYRSVTEKKRPEYNFPILLLPSQ